MIHREDPSSSASCRFIPAHNSLYFHKDLGKDGLTRVFSATSWQGEKWIFFLHLFSAA
jgi:hypothetical protein